MAEKKEIYYTICPVANATYLAVKRGFLKEGISKLGYDLIRLQTLSRDKWPAHFTYENDRLFREGGNTPPIWAKSRGTGVVLLGLNLIEEKQSILVRTDSDIHTIADLRGKRLAVPVHTDVHIDFHKATAQQGFEIALAANGIGKDEVIWKEVYNECSFTSEGKGGSFSDLNSAEVAAINAGEVDAFFDKLPVVEQLLATGKYRRLYDVANDQNTLVPVNNEYPNVLTVSRKLAEEEPEVVVEFVKQTILAARWAASNQEEAEKLLAEQTYGTVEEYRKSYAPGFYQRLEPNFAPEGLDALQKRADFLYEHNYLESRVDVDKWADDYFLKKALEELDK